MRLWFPLTHVYSILAFLAEDSNTLDRGFGLPLQTLALDGRVESEAIRWLQSGPVQDAIARAFIPGEAASLPVDVFSVGHLCHLCVPLVTCWRHRAATAAGTWLCHLHVVWLHRSCTVSE